MRLIFLGSPEAVINPLNTLLEGAAEHGHEVVAVVSQPAKPVGRKGTPEDPPVARFAKDKGLVTLQPVKASDPEFLARLKELAPDVMITAAYGQILPDAFLAIPKRGTINIHPSLLPKYRGATPVPAALLDGCVETGVTILFTVAKLDAGHIILQTRSAIRSDETTGTLTERLFAEGGILLFDALEKLAHPSFSGTPQNDAEVTHCRKIKKTDGLIDWSLPAATILNRFRAFHPWPGSYTFFQGRRIAVLRMNHADSKILPQPQLNTGEARFEKAHKALLVGTGNGTLALTSLQPAGGKPVDAAAFWNGVKNKDDVRFTSEETPG